MGWLLAVDFGTSRTAAATRVDGQPPQPLTLQGGDQMRSCVAMVDGELLCGKTAFARARLAAGFEASPKKLFDLPAGPFWGGRTVPVAEIVGTVLAYVSGAARDTRPDPPREVRLTHPAAWPAGSTQLAALTDAGKRALAEVGWGDVPLQFVPEPVAAALQAATGLDDQLEVGRCLAVYDLGAGTFDAAVVRRTSSEFEVVGETGSLPAAHAGNDFDQVIRDKLDERLADRFEDWALLAAPPEGDLELEKRARALDEAITAAKEDLSDVEETIVDVPGLAWHELETLGRVTVGELDTWVGAKVDQTCRGLRQVIEGAERTEGLTREQIAYVVLTGGSSKMRIVGTAVAEATSISVLRAGNPKTVVALGATLANLSPATGKARAKGTATKPRSGARGTRAKGAAAGSGKAAGSRPNAKASASEAYERATTLAREGRIPEAVATFKLAIDASDAEWSPRAAIDLGVLFEQQSNLAAARGAYQLAIDSGHKTWAPWAAGNLGGVLLRTQDRKGAKGAFSLALNSGQANVWPKAANGLGLLRAFEGDVAGATAYFQRAIDSGHAEQAPRAMWNLGDLLSGRDPAGARAVYRRAIDSGHKEWAPRAAIDLGRLLKTVDRAGAESAYRQAIGLGNPEWVPLAWNNLGVLLESTDKRAAKAAYQRVIDSGSRWAPRAALNLGVLLESTDKRAARVEYQRVIDSGDSECAPIAWNNLGVLRERARDVPGAREAYQTAIDSQHPEAMPRGLWNLGDLLKGREPGDARAAYQRAIDTGHQDWGPRSALDLGAMLERQGDLVAARAYYQRAAVSGHAIWEPKAKAKLARLQAHEDRQELYKAARKVFKGFSRS